MYLGWKNYVFRLYLKYAFPPDFDAARALAHQQKILKKIIGQLASTQLGKDLQLKSNFSYAEFIEKVPVTQYDFYESYVENIKAGATHIMTNQPVKWLAKTAGTTSGKSKLVPITKQMMDASHVRGSFFALSKIHQLNNSLDLLGHKNLLIPGGIYEALPSGIIVGDISALLVRNVPFIFRSFYSPEIDIQTLPNWEEKLDLAVKQIAQEDIGTISGVPTWLLSVFQKMKKEFPFEKLSDVWPNLQVYFHGGVSFEPYRKQFEDLVGNARINFYEVYNATEGFFGIQQTLMGGDLLLLTDNLIFYEFIPLESFAAGKKRAIDLSQIKTGVPYVLLITTPNGLLRYIVGDVLTFSSIDPFCFQITGRTQEYINAFGEDLLLQNVESALMKTNSETQSSIREFTVAPFYISLHQKGKIQFAIEFEHVPRDIIKYELLLDQNLQTENSNYKQKRANDLALSCCEVILIKPGTFYRWLSSKNKLGGQNKIPRLVNGRMVIEELVLLQK